MMPKTKVIVQVNLEKDASGIVYCGAFSENTAPASVSEILAQRFFAPVAKSYAEVGVSGLVAATNYRMFCATETTSGTLMEQEVAVRTFIIATTACCKAVTVACKLSNPLAHSVSVDAFTIALDSLPSASVTLKFTISSLSSLADEVLPALYPDTITFSSTSATTTAKVTFVAGSVGEYRVGVAVSGASSSSYSTQFSGASIVQVLSRASTPPTPQLQSAQFTSDGSAVKLTFSSPTNRAGKIGIIACASLLDFAGVATARCQWSDSSNLMVYPGSSMADNELLNVQSPVSLKAGAAVKAACIQTTSMCDAYESASAKTVEVTAPISSALPVVSLRVLSVVSGCADMVLDMSSSSGSGGRAWNKPVFSVTEVNGDASAAAIQTQLNAAFTFSPPTVVKNSVLAESGSYVISVTLCNFLGSCSQASKVVNVMKSAGNIPVVSIFGRQQRTIMRNTAVTLSSIAFAGTCDGKISYTGLDRSWYVLDNGVLDSTLISSSFDLNTFRLAAYRLVPLHTYTIVFKVVSLESTLSTSSSVSIYVERSPIVAVIQGGDTQSVAIAGSITLDASSSSDGDVSSATGAAAGLLFSWTCIQVTPSYSSVCPLDLRAESAVVSVLLPATETLQLFANTRSINTTSQITVTVTDAAGVRSSIAAVTLLTQDSSAPIVAITTSASKLTYVNPDNQLVLTGRIAVQSSCFARWSVDSRAVNMDSALTPPVSVIPSGSSRLISLVLPGSALPMRETLSFSLSCGQSVAAVTVTTNGPPQPGKFAVSPVSGGVALTTSFQFTASFWTDANLPISYQFGFLSPSSGVTMTLQARSEQSSSSSYLPSGSTSVQFMITATVQVFDVLNAVTTATSAVEVGPHVESSAALDSILKEQLSACEGNVDALKGAISLSSEAINSVSCDNAPVCTALNRMNCGKVRDTCGSCLVGYIGESGDHNSLCLSVEELSGTASTAGTTCTRTEQCSGWEFCSEDTNLCTILQKICDADCAAHGVCTLVNINSKAVVGDCRQNDPTCEAVCKCMDGYSGTSCSIDSDTMYQKQIMRSALISSLRNVTLNDDVTQDTVTVWSRSLSALTQDSNELSVSTVSAIHSLANAVLQTAALTSGVTYATAAGILDAMSSASEASERSGASILAASDTLDVLAQFSDMVSSQLVAGQSDVSFVYPNFRMSSVRTRVTAGSCINVSVPQTALEKFSGDAMFTSVVIDPEQSSEDEEVAVNLVTTKAASYGSAGSAFNTNPLQVRIARSSNVPTTVRVVLVHNVATNFSTDFAADEMMFNTTCTGSSRGLEVTSYKCPISGTVLVHNCTGLRGVMVSYCPIVKPVCVILDPITGTLDANSSICITGAYDAHSTECVCTLPVAASRRRLSNALEQSGVLDVVSSSLYLASGFGDTFMEAGEMNSLEDFQKVLIVITMFATLWGAGLLVIIGCAFRRKWMAGHHENSKSTLGRKMQSAQMSRSPAAVRQYLVDYVVEVFPSVFSNKPFVSRVFGEIKRHHRYLTIFTAPETESGDKQRILTSIQVLTVQTMLMFLLALLYDIQSPTDNGSCVFHTEEVECVAVKSPFDQSQSYCAWTQSEGNSEFSCVYQEPQFSMQVVIYIAVMVALMVAIISYPVDRIFELLSSPVADELKLSTKDTATKRIGKRLSVAARRASNVALGAMTAAKDKVMNARSSIVGTVTRKLPGQTEAAHDLAAASITVIAENSLKQQQERQLARMRTYFASGGNRFASQFGKYYDEEDQSSSSSSSDSESDSDSDTSYASRVKNRETQSSRVDDRSAERTGSTSTARSNSEVGTVARRPSGGVSQAEVDALMLALAEEVRCQRRLLKPSELELFDEQWGLNPTGEFLEASVVQRRLLCLKGPQGAKELIRKEVEFVKAESARKVEKLNIATDKHTGLEILHLFIKDLLGRNTPAARIFETKAEEDFEHTTVVSMASKRIAVALLVGINAFFVYYAMLTGFRRGVSWQRVYLAACVIQFFVEICLFETMECVWINYVIPTLVSSEVRGVGESVIEVVQHLCANGSMESEMFLNAPEYLFVSTNVAKKFPHLMESILVQAYVSHLPGELAKTWHEVTMARMNRHQTVGRVAILASVLATLQYLGTAPFIIHRMFIRLVQPFVLSGLVLLWSLVITDSVSIGVTCGLLVLLVGVIAFFSYRSGASHMDVLNTIAPDIPQEHAEKGGVYKPSQCRGSLNLAAAESTDDMELCQIPDGILRMGTIPVNVNTSAPSNSKSSCSSSAGDDTCSAALPEICSPVARVSRAQRFTVAVRKVGGADCVAGADDSTVDASVAESSGISEISACTDNRSMLLSYANVQKAKRYVHGSSNEGSKEHWVSTSSSSNIKEDEGRCEEIGASNVSSSSCGETESEL